MRSVADIITAWSAEKFKCVMLPGLGSMTCSEAAAVIEQTVWRRESLAAGLAALEGIVLHEIKSTVGPADDANNWREYLGRADDLVAFLAAHPSAPVSTSQEQAAPSASEQSEA